MKISDYPATAYPGQTDSFVVDGAAGTKRVTLNDLSYSVSGGFAPERVRRTNAKNTSYRGKSLGTLFTAPQLNTIRSGDFQDLWIGDFWTIHGRVWRIADFDYWYGTGDPASAARHVVIMPDNSLYSAAWNANGSTNGGYLNSDIYKTGLQQAKTIIHGAFGETNILSHFGVMTSAAVDGRVTGCLDVQTKVDLPNENMIWGGPMNKVMNVGNPVNWTQEVCGRQLSLFHVAPSLRFWGASYWLRDIVSGTDASFVDAKGVAGINSSQALFGVRPVFAIG